ncbi:MAG: histone deacetylase [Gemmatimonadetes bacterium]|uniref:Histone deacetylase n=1 Tax=Candidatus Kutchimonas denitrificans TaxID=3056748 RepID=A0AAE4Z7A0_9BACT|nr:histone deacetylase [Gemmatimonadota bacterium]NIR73536.1 histone deacetylase [Candidatus Kutchimonas denitrificans]NIR99495.1 histone deacetylase [Gemmatimonadota bacterium]NIT65115.1 histone deacetylase [Gemmatimonadota bacterium]NIV23648.1 histone deacetylase [Gemmatimonadota bacterium]
MSVVGELPIVWDEAYEADIGVHVFPTRKYRAIRDRLLNEGTISEDSIRRPQPAADEQIALVHTAGYLSKMTEGRFSRQDELLLELPYSNQLKQAMWLCAGGSILTGRLALERGLAAHLGGGFHHAFPDHGEGFCLINDVAVALRVLRADGSIERAAVFDCDLHQGNGTAAIFSEEPEVYTFSIHQQNNYPMWKPPSDRDLGLADGIGDTEYLRLLREYLPSILEDHRPDLVFYLAGADPYREDQLGRLELSLDGLRERDESVLEMCAARQVPVAIALAGGYALRFEDTVEIHCNTVRAAVKQFELLGN